MRVAAAAAMQSCCICILLYIREVGGVHFFSEFGFMA